MTPSTMILVGRHSDRTLERRFHAGIGYLTGAAGLVGIGLCANKPALAFTALVFAVAGPTSAHPVFWQIPPMLLAGSAALPRAGSRSSTRLACSRAGSALWVVGWLEDVTGKTATGLYIVAGRFLPRCAVGVK
jgi:hypothetical protein